MRSAEEIAKDFLDTGIHWIGGAPVYDARVLARAYLQLLKETRRVRRPSTGRAKEGKDGPG